MLHISISLNHITADIVNSLVTARCLDVLMPFPSNGIYSHSRVFDMIVNSMIVPCCVATDLSVTVSINFGNS